MNILTSLTCARSWTFNSSQICGSFITVQPTSILCFPRYITGIVYSLPLTCCRIDLRLFQIICKFKSSNKTQKLYQKRYYTCLHNTWVTRIHFIQIREISDIAVKSFRGLMWWIDVQLVRFQRLIMLQKSTHARSTFWDTPIRETLLKTLHKFNILAWGP